MSCNGCLGGCSACTPMATSPVYSPIKPRSQIVGPNDTIRLGILFRGPDGFPRDTDAFPTVTIINTQGTVVIGPTSSGVFRVDEGEYAFDYQLPIHINYGVWRDVWEAEIDAFSVRGEGTFQVNYTQMPGTNTDGYVALGDDVGFCYSQTAICNINKLLKALKRRLKSSGVRSSCDEFGNIIYETCDIFSIDELVTFLADSMSMFNEIPTFTMFTFDDTEIIELFFDVIVQGATYLALGAQALIERGKEFTMSDNGLGFTPPSVAEMLNSQYTKEMDAWTEKIKLIKMNMRPAAIGLGTMRPLASTARYRRMQMLRQRAMY